MKAVVFHAVGDIRLDEVPEPTLQAPTDAIVRITASAICGTDLHFIRGSAPDMQPGTILGHEAVGIVEALGEDVRNLQIGDRVLIPSTIACGNCSYCRAGYFAQCDVANPNGKTAGTSFFGGPKNTGPFNGLQAEKARIPFAHIGLIKLPPEITDDQAIAMSDIFPTAWFGAEMAQIKDGDTVAVLGCGPVGLFAIVSARLMGAGRVFAIDCLDDRLARARELGAECINFDKEDPVKTIARLTADIGVDCAIDAVGIDADHAHDHGQQRSQWQPGDEPSQALQWAVECVAKAGTISIIGVYPAGFDSFPIGAAMNKNIRINMGNCHHRKYIPKLIEMTLAGRVDPSRILTQDEPLTDAISAFKAFDTHQSGWIKVKLEPGANGSTAND
ncbi:Zinc-containing alcohol dehydrogenase superfamily protein [Pseudomonas fluorescens]|uniref:Zinc-containing alcohol dehydrogenase superfamily protein n=1 Tax=Pseudomonas fluorescens TaxID=294 RepID=A0A3S5E9N0_PSEFL|nr:zinc-dependent alcohol dehydrogenase [Pseudomonas fluorescens]VEF11566.1 Zinc-containing alcohol dehydrogenase superfamily protein [Pseudomonas fluorescens]